MRSVPWVLGIWVVFVSGGATCARRSAPSPFPPPPVALSDAPSIGDVIASINRTDAVEQLSTNSASVDVLSTPALPTLSATVNLQRERNFRFRAKLPVVMGAGIDMGSNAQTFWLEVPDGFKRKLFFARHDEFQQQLSRSVLPVDPTWLINAVGLVHIDPSAVVAGPVTRDDGSLEIRTTKPTAAGMYQNVYFVDASGGFVTHQFLYAPDGRQVASAVNSNHRYYQSVDCALPHRIQFELTPAAGQPISMQIDVVAFAINQLLSGDADLFVMPNDGAEAVDLVRMSGAMAASPTPDRFGQLGNNGSFSRGGAAAYTATQTTALPMR